MSTLYIVLSGLQKKHEYCAIPPTTCDFHLSRYSKIHLPILILTAALTLAKLPALSPLLSPTLLCDINLQGHIFHRIKLPDCALMQVLGLTAVTSEPHHRVEVRT